MVAVGEQSEWGKTMALVGEAGDEDTPLQEKLADMAASIGKVRTGREATRAKAGRSQGLGPGREPSRQMCCMCWMRWFRSGRHG